MGEVFVARTPWAENPVAAVKRLRPDVAAVPTFAERFQHESELAVRLEHDNVVNTLDVGSVNGQLYVASELVMGKDTGIIADRLRERGQGGPAAVAIRMMLDVLTGLAYVHEVRDLDGTPLQLVHRDITPGNVLVGYDGVARLADFGLAKSHLTQKANLTQHGEILGTPHYLAPEIIRGDAASSCSDLYGLGAVIYRFLTGVAPHQGTTTEVLLKVLSEDPRPLRDLRPDLSSWLVEFVHGLLVKQPSLRPSDARALAAELGEQADATGLLVAPSAVGRWLGDLFTDEKAEEFEERERLVAITADDYEPASEGTVVLAARPRTGSRFRALTDDGSGPAATYDSLSRTDLSLDDDTDDRFESKAAVPDEMIATASDEMDDLDGMPTRAVLVRPGDLDFDEESGTHDMIAPPDRAAPAAKIAETDDLSTALPGFVDAGARPGAADTGGVPPKSGPVVRQRPRGPDSVIVAPVIAADQIRSAREASVSVDRRAEPRPPPAAVSRAPRVGPAPASRRSALAPLSSLAAAYWPGRSAVLLAGMLAVAVLLGVFVGALVVSYRDPGVAITSRGPLHERLFRVQTELVARVERGEAVPAEVWSKVTKVHAALRRGDEVQAAALLRQLERTP